MDEIGLLHGSFIAGSNGLCPAADKGFSNQRQFNMDEGDAGDNGKSQGKRRFLPNMDILAVISGFIPFIPFIPVIKGFQDRAVVSQFEFWK